MLRAFEVSTVLQRADVQIDSTILREVGRLKQQESGGMRESPGQECALDDYELTPGGIRSQAGASLRVRRSEGDAI